VNPNITDPQVPIHILIRRRRQELRLLQADVAEMLNVTTECIGLWESGRRRMHLCRLPYIAEALHIDAEQLCAAALAEFYPLFYATLFGAGSVPRRIASTAPA
jgi:transcriptional regulator with XRE-family HTH domain